MCWGFTQSLSATLTAPSLARDAVTARLRAHADLRVDQAAIEDVRLVVSELASNAVHATGDEFVVVLEVHHGEAIVEVADTSSEIPRLLRPDPTNPHGRGLQLVTALATTWGFERRAVGKAVWARLPLLAYVTENLFCEVTDLTAPSTRP
jgi:two-component sensor histidine kinase